MNSKELKSLDVEMNCVNGNGKPGVLIHAYTLSARQVEAGGLGLQSYPQLRTKFEAGLCYMYVRKGFVGGSKGNRLGERLLGCSLDVSDLVIGKQ